ncbi:hypothetical protein NQZ68_011329 [Dissostichus eleginoides]|nr:hypothetical protein NQZ68_011329 [Dissostichus eleginoides]
MDKFFTLVWCLVEDLMTVGQPASPQRGTSSGQAQGASRGRHSHTDIAHSSDRPGGATGQE